ncbi:TetR family transcriptional regulator C-terminal domain-containing protein [bacterium SCSIO 12741]|nr:TetR family transcriptional regulator C-terminal domain-containing protein [bacterium SCSIO 12741]
MTKDKAIEAGLKLFFQKGYGNVGLTEILKTAEIPKGSFYHHFGSKDDFIREVLDKYSSSGLADFKALLLENKTKTPKERIYHFYAQRTDEIEAEEFNKGCLLGDSCNQGGLSEDSMNFVDQQLGKWQMVIELCLDEAKSLGQLNEQADTRMLAAVIQNGWEGALLRMKASKSRQPLDDFLASIDLLVP